MVDYSGTYRHITLYLPLLIRYRQLLASPTFHRAVQNVHKRIRHMKHGPDLEEMGGTKIDSGLCRKTIVKQCADCRSEPTKNFLDHYLEEIKEQFRGGPPQKK